MYKKHEAFDSPPLDAILWRYMDFAKYISLLDRRALFFARADTLDDPFEGSVTEATPRLPGEHTGGLVALRRAMRSNIFVNCWYESDDESAAMWKLYARNAGIAVRSTFAGLAKSILTERRIYVGRINYIDYVADPMPTNNAFTPFLHKRKSFEHEREVRAVSQEYKGEEFYEELIQDGDGIYYRVDVHTLINEVVVAPSAKTGNSSLLNRLPRSMDCPTALGVQSWRIHPLSSALLHIAGSCT